MKGPVAKKPVSKAAKKTAKKAGAKKAPARKVAAKKKPETRGKSPEKKVKAAGPSKRAGGRALPAGKKKPKKKPGKARGVTTSPTVEKEKGGRPSKLTAEVLEKICEGLRLGKPLTIVCQGEGMPAPRTVRDWMTESEEVSAAIAGAREEGGDYIAWQILKIADNTGHEDKDTIITDFGDIPNKEWIMRSKLRCDVRLQLLAKWHPKRYGTKVEVSGDGEKPLQHQLTFAPGMQEAIVAAAAHAANVKAPGGQA